jgi:hypothetical protein
LREAVAVVTLDGLVAAFGLARVDFIKADIEGFEGAMVAGGREVLRTFRPALLLEMDDHFLRRAGSSFNELWDELTVLGYGAHDGRTGKAINAGIPTDGDVLWLPRLR